MLTVRVTVALRKPEVNDEHRILGQVVAANQEIVRLDVSMDDSFLMNLLYALDLKVLACLAGLTIWMPMSRTVLRSNCRRQAWKRSSSEGPSMSMTMM